MLALCALKIELHRWSLCGHTPVLWWRDDDVRDPTEALDRLLGLAAGLPLSLAVIPDGDRSALAARLSQASHVTISQHGVDHANRSPPGGPACEYGPLADVDQKIEQIARGRANLLAAGLEPVFYTPPWNAIDSTLPLVLKRVGYRYVSAYERSAPTAGLKRVDCSLDMMRWRGRARFRGCGRLLWRLTRLLRERRRANAFDTPVGLLTHHLAHDEPSWAFLEWFLAFGRGRFNWRSYEQIAAS